MIRKHYYEIWADAIEQAENLGRSKKDIIFYTLFIFSLAQRFNLVIILLFIEGNLNRAKIFKEVDRTSRESTHSSMMENHHSHMVAMTETGMKKGDPYDENSSKWKFSVTVE